MILILTNSSIIASSLKKVVNAESSYKVRVVGEGKINSAIDATLELCTSEYDRVVYIGSYGSSMINVGTIVVPSNVICFETYVDGIENIPSRINTSMMIDDVCVVSICSHISQDIDAIVSKDIKTNTVFDGETASVINACNVCGIDCDVIGIVSYNTTSVDSIVEECDLLKGSEYINSIIKFLDL